jgi:hypothetical protein
MKALRVIANRPAPTPPIASQSAVSEILFQNEFVSLLLVQLKREQSLCFEEPALRLLTVVRGQLQVRGPDGSYILRDMARRRLERGKHWQLHAITDTQLLLFVAKVAA